MVRQAICKLLREFGLAKLEEVVANLDGYARDDVEAELRQMIKFGAVRYDGKHFWRTDG